MSERDTETDGGIGSTIGTDDRLAGSAAAADGDTEATGSEFFGRDLEVGYASEDDLVIDEESIRAAPGHITALVGPNGSGKSTLLKGLADQLSLDGGTVRLDGRDVQSLGTKELARKLGLLSQENVAPTSITVEKLVTHGRYPHRDVFGALDDDDREAIDRAISLAGVEQLRDREVGSLSGGQKQLVWIAMSIAQETDVLLLDEPTTFLDLHHQLEVMQIVERLRDERDVTIVVVLHDITQAARYADYMIALKDGTICDRGPPGSVVTETLLERVFEVEAAVENTPNGPQITPLEPLHDDEPTETEEAEYDSAGHHS